MIVPSKEELTGMITRWIGQVFASFKAHMSERERRVFWFLTVINTTFQKRLTYYESLIHSLPIYFQSFLHVYEERNDRLNISVLQLLSNVENYCRLKKQRFLGVHKALLSYSPKNTLKRGYCIVKSGQTIIKSSASVKVG